MSKPLTDEEREALTCSCTMDVDEPGNSTCVIHGWESPGLYAVVEGFFVAREKEAKAGGWDEGHVGCDCLCYDGVHGAFDGRICSDCINPYRTEA